MKTPAFTHDASMSFYRELTARVNAMFSKQSWYAGYWFWIKAVVYAAGFITSFMYVLTAQHFFVLLTSYMLMGLFVLLLVFNVAHDAAHQTVSRHNWINRLCYTLTFPLLGNHPYVWRHFHLASHHVYTNVEGSDIDVVTNPLLRLNASQPVKRFHRWQWLYAPVVYVFYTLHFVLLRDLVELTGGKARTVTIRLTAWQWMKYIVSKSFYFFYALVLPYMLTPFSFGTVLVAFLAMHACMSVIIVLVLACNHQVDLTCHIDENETEKLPFSWVTLQLQANLDYSSDSRVWHALVGGFNSHTVHHLFPAINHTHYRKLVPVIRQVSAKHQITYNETGWLQALKSHFRFLKKMGTC